MNHAISTDRCHLIPIVFPETLDNVIIEEGYIITSLKMINNLNSSYIDKLYNVLKQDSVANGCNFKVNTDVNMTHEWVNRKVNQGCYLWLVQFGDTIIGFVNLKPLENYDNIRSFNISGGGLEDFRRLRLGSEIMTVITEYAFSKLSATKLLAGSKESNEPSIRLIQGQNYHNPIVKTLTVNEETIKIIWYEK